MMSFSKSLVYNWSMGKNKVYESHDSDNSDDDDEDFGSRGGCFPSGGYPPPYPPFGPPKPDLTEKLLQALIESHKTQIQCFLQMFEQQQYLFRQITELKNPQSPVV